MNRMLRAPEVMARIGCSRVTLWRWVRAGNLPAPVELGRNMIGWREEEIEEWIQSRPRRTYGSDNAGVISTEKIES